MPPPFLMPATITAVQDAAVLVQTAWIAAADALPDTSNRARYVAGLITPQSRLYPYQGNDLAALVQNVAQAAPRIEQGTPAIHLPSRIRWAQSKAARQNKQGRWYIRVPFRHTSFRASVAPAARLGQGMMPQSVTRIARQLRPGQYLTGGRAGLGAQRAVYAPGMMPYVPRNLLNVRPGYRPAARQEGLRRVQGRGGRASYMTFRTMTQDSQGWWLPAKPGVQLVSQVVRQARPAVTAMIEAAARQDIDALIRHLAGGGTP